MKRSLCWALSLLILFSCIAFAGAEELYTYHSDFSAGPDGWYARSTGGAALAFADGALTITGRGQDWHSPGRDFPLEDTAEYDLSVQVYQDSVDSASMMISIAHKTADGAETYENLAFANVKKGQWTTLSGHYKAGEFTTYVLYVETSGAAELEYSMKDFTVTQTKAAVKKPAAADAADRIDPMTLPALKDAYADKFDVGCAVNGWDAANPQKLDIYAHQFNIFTHENDFKPDSVLDVTASRKLAKEDPTAVAISIAKGENLLRYAQENGIKVHGHVLVWHNQTPEAFFHEEYNPAKPFVTREVMLGRLENYIRQVLTTVQTQYPGVIVSWDVVNEAVADGSAGLRQSNWTKVVGEDFVNQAFAFARKYADPEVKLYYNDYSTPYEPKLTGICNLLDSLIADGNIDGYGFQCHYQLGSPSYTQLRAAFERIAGKGLKLRVSELDITIPDTGEATLLRQAERYQRLFDIYGQYADQMEAVQVWGVTDDRSWKSAESPLLFDRNLQPKPAFWALTDPTKLPAGEAQPAEEAPASLPVAKAVYGLDAIESAEVIAMNASLSADYTEGGKVSVTGKAAWDEKNLYVQMTVIDPWLNASSPNSYEQDSVELFVDEKNDRSATYGDDDHHYRVNYKGELTIDAGFDTVTADVALTDTGFTALFTMPFTVEVKEGQQLGFDLRYNDAAPDGVRRLVNFCDASDTGWNDPNVFGLLELVK
ncbi:MAG: endo-1,4-beta-xylanase [Clostridia bacterium]|nr:endo-1,4-beta-xylanase [Clostridia bacterium]